MINDSYIKKIGFFENLPLFNMVWKEEYFYSSLDHSVGILTKQRGNLQKLNLFEFLIIHFGLFSDDEAFNIKVWPLYFLSLAFIFLFFFFFRTSVIAVCKAMEVLKAIESTFHRHSLAISSLSGHVYQKLASSIILTIEKAKVRPYSALK